jgi:hypothetical protein
MPRTSTIRVWGAVVLAVTRLATPAAGAQSILSPSIAHYEVSHEARTERLDMVRTADRIEHRYLTRGVSEVWSRTPRGELEHWKVFHQPKRSVHYTAGDLRTIEAEPSWEQLATLIHPAERLKLKTKGTRRVGAGTATVLEGELAHQRARVLWNASTGWAQEVALGAGHHRKKYRLLAAEACSPATCAPFDASSVREIEFADLGDMETDPFVRTFLATFAGHAHAHPTGMPSTRARARHRPDLAPP